MTYTKSTNLVIYETNDLSKFKLFPDNRKVVKNASLEEDILDCNKLKYHPITVTPDMEVIDGQHRLEICKKNGLSIFYMVDNEFQKNDIMSVQSSKKWRQGDYLHYYSKNKINPYVIMDNIISKYPICITTFIRMFCTNTDKHMTRQFVSGKISLKYKEKEIEEIMRQFEEVKKICHYLFGYRKYSRDFETAMISVLMTIKNSENGSFEHFKERLQHSAAQIEKATYLNSLVLIKKVFIDEIYNFNMKKNKLSIC